MNRYDIQSISVKSAKEYRNSGYIDDDLILFDRFQDLPIPQEPRRLSGLIVGICLQGKAQYTVDTEERMIRPNDVIIINDNQIIDNYMSSPDFNGVAMIISLNFFNNSIKDITEISQLFIFSRSHPVFNIEAEKTGMLKAYYAALKYKVNDTDNHFRSDIVQSIFLTLIYEISNIIYNRQQSDNQKQSRADYIFAEFIGLVEKNFRTERRVAWYADQIHITPKYLSETIKQISHKTPNEWIDQYVALEIRVLLKNTNLTIKEITNELNFPNQSFLGKFFKDKVGISPLKYRRSKG